MPETHGQPELREEDAIDVEWQRRFEQARAMVITVIDEKPRYLTVFGAQIAASRPLYLIYAAKVAPEDFMAAAVQPEDGIEVVNARLVRSGRYRIDDLPDPRPPVPEFREPAFTFSEELRQARQGSYNTEGPPIRPVEDEEAKPKLTLRQRLGITSNGDPNRPSNRPGASWARRKRQRAREREAGFGPPAPRERPQQPRTPAGDV